MKSTWNSRTRVAVDGEAFRSARIMFKSTDKYLEEKKDHKRGDFPIGSQEWLGVKAGVSPRVVTSLENGKASINVVDAVSHALGITNGRQYILGYGEQATKVSAKHLVDFRPTINGHLEGNEEAYTKVPFLITIDPINIQLKDQFIDEAVLNSMQLRLSVGEAYADMGKDLSIDFIWLNNVTLTEAAKTWLGDPEEVSEVTIKTGQPYKKSVMFRQDSSPPVTWESFCKYIREMGAKEDMEYPRILLSLTLKFEYFEKQIPVLISIAETKSLMENYYPEGCPYWIQPKALTHE